MKISVIVPIYNSFKYLNKCLDSLVNQTIDDYEIILVNDGSKDDSHLLIDEYVKKYPNVRSFYKENGGQSSARNYGLRKAKGKYVSFIDSDDYVSKDFLLKMYEKATTNDSDICFTNYYNDYGKEVLKNKVYIIFNSDHVSGKEYLLTDPCPWNKIYKKTFLDDISFIFPEGRIYEDFSHIFSLVSYNPSISFVDDYLIYYVHSEESTMRKKEYTKKYEDIFEAIDYLVKKVSKDYKMELEYIVTYHFLYLASLNFYKYGRHEMIDKIADYMNRNFKNYRKNIYYKNYSKKEKILCYLFYTKKYYLIKFVQNIKGVCNGKKKQNN